MSRSLGETRQGRMAGVDAARFVAFLAVCFVHTARWGRPPAWTPDAVDGLTLACRFCVPFFFLASGYFAASDRPPAGKRAPRGLPRLGGIFLIWAGLYIVLTPGGAARLCDLRFDLLTLIDGGPGYHLWFLPALAFGFLAAQRLRGGSRRLAWSVVLAAWIAGGLAAAIEGRIGAYAARYLSAVAYVGAGALWREAGGSKALAAPRLTTVLALTLGGLAAEVAQASLFAAAHLRTADELEFPLGAGGLGGALFLAALSWKPGSAAERFASAVGRGTLGLYAVHLGIAMLLFTQLPHATLTDRLAGFALTAAAAVALVGVLRRTALRPIVQ